MKDNRLLYRYISFESFVDMSQKQALTFVLPEEWDDPTDKKAFDNVIDLLDDDYLKIQLDIVKRKTFCQCWTTLYQSDAMWRIYSYNNFSIRIKAYENDLMALNNEIIIRNIEYSNDPITLPVSEKNTVTSESIAWLVLDSLSRKRTAFAHEKEVRLILPFSFSDKFIDPANHLAAYFSCFGSSEQRQFLKSELNTTINVEDISECKKLLNIDEFKTKTKDISFKGRALIKGVMVNPFAPPWYVETVKTFCENNNILFEGRSALYDS